MGFIHVNFESSYFEKFLSKNYLLKNYEFIDYKLSDWDVHVEVKNPVRSAIKIENDQKGSMAKQGKKMYYSYLL